MQGRDQNSEASALSRTPGTGSFDSLLQGIASAPARALLSPDSELGQGRFRIDALIGQGGQGDVYRAFDRERQRWVALKLLSGAPAGEVTRIKSEFRALSGVRHPNLVGLHELFGEGGRWFFSMDLVAGDHLLAYLAGHDERFRLAGPARGTELTTLRALFGQLAQGVRAIHAAGMLHRDLKPSNVRVSPAGHLVVLDFGLVTSQQQAAARGGAVVGTPAYMAPEQLSGSALPESDWYAVGCMLYVALAGHLPYRGPARQVRMEKQRGALPADPRTVSDALPADLCDLCLSLLENDPAERPDADAILTVLCRGSGPQPADARPDARAPLPLSPPFVGRQRELARLRAALQGIVDESARTSTQLLLVGPSGAGKSRLLERFVRDAMQGSDALVLSGRCYESEAVPYKTLDGVVDAICEHLRGQSADARAACLPADMSALCRVFPALRGVAVAPAEPAPPPEQQGDAHERRLRAFGALKALLRALAAARPLVMVIDDLQWGDLDGAELLLELLSPPDAPRLLFVGAHRDGPPGPCLERLSAASSTGLRFETVTLPALHISEATALAGHLLGDADGEGIATRVAKESLGNPLFIAELAAHHRNASPDDDHEPRLSQLIGGRLQALSPAHLRLLRVVALSDRPLDRRVAQLAAGIAPGSDALAGLRAARLVRAHGARLLDAVECFHDQVRRTVLETLPQTEARVLHLRLAEALVAQAGAELALEAEAVAAHYLAAAEPGRALPLAREAADEAMRTLAFERAARLYALALELSEPRGRAHGELLLARAEALSLAGRLPDAAETFQQAAAASEGGRQQVAELERRAADAWLRCGHHARGTRLLRKVSLDLGLPFPETKPAVLAGVLWRSVQLRYRGFDRLRTTPSADAPSVSQLDACWNTGWGLWIVDPLRFALMMTEFSLGCLARGEPDLVARAQCVQALSSIVSGPHRLAHSLQHIAQARARAHSAYARAHVWLAEAGVHVQCYRHRDALRCAEAAVELLREACVGVTFELSLARLYIFFSLTGLGRFAELRRRLGPFEREAARGDQFCELQAATFNGLSTMMEDGDMAPACQRLRDILLRVAAPTRRDFITAEITVELYAGQVERAWQAITRLERELGAVGRNARLFSTRVEYNLRRGQCAVKMAARDTRHARRYLVAARDAARALRREGHVVPEAYAALVEAGIAEARGQHPQLERALRAAARDFDAADMPAYAAVARHRLGTLGDDHARHRAAADFVTFGIRNPPRLVHIYGLGTRSPLSTI